MDGVSELKEDLIRNLEENGILGHIQAQLKAAVYLTLESQDSKLNQQYHNSSLAKQVKSEQECALFSLIVDALQSLKLTNTLRVLESEASLRNIDLRDREQLESEFSVCPTQESPVLSAVLHRNHQQRHGESSLSVSIDSLKGVHHIGHRDKKLDEASLLAREIPKEQYSTDKVHNGFSHEAEMHTVECGSTSGEEVPELLDEDVEEEEADDNDSPLFSLTNSLLPFEPEDGAMVKPTKPGQQSPEKSVHSTDQSEEVRSSADAPGWNSRAVTRRPDSSVQSSTSPTVTRIVLAKSPRSKASSAGDADSGSGSDIEDMQAEDLDFLRGVKTPTSIDKSGDVSKELACDIEDDSIASNQSAGLDYGEFIIEPKPNQATLFCK